MFNIQITQINLFSSSNKNKHINVMPINEVNNTTTKNNNWLTQKNKRRKSTY